MKTPKEPANEAERLAALRSYEILDTPTEPSFDGIARLAASILETPIALVSLVDTDRQWFKARYGLDVPETSREVSFCAHVVEAGSSLVVTDAHADDRFADNPLTTGAPRVRFYAGMPLRTPSGMVLGTLCAIGHEPRTPTAKQLEMLELLSIQVADQLEAHRARRQHANASARLTALFTAMSEGVVVQDQQGAIVEANPAASRILGITNDQLMGRTSVDASWKAVKEDGSPFPGPEHPAMVTLRTGEPCAGVVMGVHRTDGVVGWIRINSVPVSGPAGRVVTTFHDITDLKAAQAAAQRLARQEHLITTGTLAAGVGHEINNPLAFINANLEFAIEELRSIAGGSSSQRIKELISILGEAREGGDRIRKIVRGLRALARSETDAIPIALEGVIDMSINMAAHECRAKATVTSVLAQTPPVLADDSRLTQVLVNLIVNAAQAFETQDPSRNRITITSAPVGLSQVAISVADNGPGIPPRVLQRIFDPFFTTKPVGVGTGLGLSISQNIMKTLGGDLTVSTEVGRGTTFRVLLPIASVPLGAAAETRPRGRRGRVLVLDDEVGIQNALRRMLQADHDVSAFADARQGLALIESGQRYDVIFCDLMMPTMSGEGFYQRLLELAPDQAARIVFFSGALAEPGSGEFLMQVPNERLEKPFSIQNVRGIARRFVGSEPATPRSAAREKGPTAAG